MFKSWCSTQNFNNRTNLSHVLLDGGVLSVPFDKLNDFYEKYIEAVKCGEKLFVVEQKTPTYNFFVDIDYKHERALTLDEIKSICKIICDKVKRHGGKDCLISVAPPKNSGGLIKTGVHLNWSGFVVNQTSALALREHILIALTYSKSNVDWNNVIDSSVYGCNARKTQGSGLRMPWSYKKEKHDACKGIGCPECGGKKIDQVAYLPLFMYTHGPLSALINIEQTPNINFLKMSSIRTDATEYITITSPSFNQKEGSFSNEQTKDELYDESIRSDIQGFIRKNVEGQKDSFITKIFKHTDSYLISTTSKYCENIKRSHNSNHIWFYISGKVIAQKCFCRCETLHGRHDGFCKDFYGRKHELPLPIVSKLYPNLEDIKKCPIIKKSVKKVSIDFSLAKSQLENYINKFMSDSKDVKIVDLSKKGNIYTIVTTSNYCDTIKGIHEDSHMLYQVNKGEIYQKCLKCKKNAPRKYRLTSTISKIIFPN
jgi:hypothetical protein